MTNKITTEELKALLVLEEEATQKDWTHMFIGGSLNSERVEVYEVGREGSPHITIRFAQSFIDSGFFGTTDAELIAKSRNIIKALILEVLEAREKINKYEKVIQYCYDACLCERFITKGFNYHETHPKLGNKGGTRSKTPTVYIEDVIGFDWEYENPKGVCKSWKALRLKKKDQTNQEKPE